MKSFRNFLTLALLPILVFFCIAWFTKENKELQNPHVITFTISFFIIVAFCSVYNKRYFKKSNYSFYKEILFNGLVCFITVFVFANIFRAVLRPDGSFMVPFFQAILGLCGFFLEYLLLYIFEKKKSAELTFNEKPLYYFLLILSIATVEVVLYLLMSINFNGDNTVSEFLKIHSFMLYYLIWLPLPTFGCIRLLAHFRLFGIGNVLLSALLTTAVTVGSVLLLNNSMNTHYGILMMLFLIGFFTSLSIYTILYYRAQLRKKGDTIKTLNLSVATKEARYSELKNQVNPHFLFNNLNTLISFIETDADKAIAFGHHLSNVYRHYLKRQNDDFILLNEELSFIEEYLAIYKAKFEKGITYSIAKDESNSLYLVSYCLQEVVDNIFKHNVSDDENVLQISIEVVHDIVVIRNSILRNFQSITNGFGLQNITERYRYLTNTEVVITDDSQFFSVALPLLKIEE